MDNHVSVACGAMIRDDPRPAEDLFCAPKIRTA